MTAVLHLQNASVRFGRVQALQEVSMVVQRGE